MAKLTIAQKEEAIAEFIANQTKIGVKRIALELEAEGFDAVLGTVRKSARKVIRSALNAVADFDPDENDAE